MAVAAPKRPVPAKAAGKHRHAIGTGADSDNGLFEPMKVTKKNGIVEIRDIALVDEHTIFDELGEFVAECDTPMLKWIAANSNQNYRELNEEIPVTLGHSRDDAPESEQPPIVGYCRDLFVAPLVNPVTGASTGRNAIYARTMWFAEEDVAKYDLKRFPRRSVELWLDDRPCVDPVALLGASAPERSLGVMRLSKKGKRVRCGELGPLVGCSLKYARSAAMPFTADSPTYADNNGDDLVGRIIAAMQNTDQMKFLEGLMSDPGMMEAFLARHSPQVGLDDAIIANGGEEDLNMNGVTDVLDERTELQQPVRHLRGPIRHDRRAADDTEDYSPPSKPVAAKPATRDPLAISGMPGGPRKRPEDVRPMVNAHESEYDDIREMANTPSGHIEHPAHGNFASGKVAEGGGGRMQPQRTPSAVNRFNFGPTTNRFATGHQPQHNYTGGVTRTDEHGNVHHFDRDGEPLRYEMDDQAGPNMGDGEDMATEMADGGPGGPVMNAKTGEPIRLNNELEDEADMNMDDDSMLADEYEDGAAGESSAEAALEDMVDEGEESQIDELEDIDDSIHDAEDVTESAIAEEGGHICPHCNGAGRIEAEIADQGEEVLEEGDEFDGPMEAAEEVVEENPIRNAAGRGPLPRPKHPSDLAGTARRAGQAAYSMLNEHPSAAEPQRPHGVGGGRGRDTVNMPPMERAYAASGPRPGEGPRPPQQSIHRARGSMDYDQDGRAMASSTVGDDAANGDESLHSKTVTSQGVSRQAPQKIQRAKLETTDTIHTGPPKPGDQHPIRRSAASSASPSSTNVQTPTSGIGKRQAQTPSKDMVNTYKNPEEIPAQLARSSQARRPVKRMRTANVNTAPQEMLSAEEIATLRERLQRLDVLENENHTLRQKVNTLEHNSGILIRNARQKAFREKLSRRRSELLMAENEGIELDLNEEMGEPGTGDAYVLPEQQWQRKMEAIKLRYRRRPGNILPINPNHIGSPSASTQAAPAFGKKEMWEQVRKATQAGGGDARAADAAYREALGTQVG